MMAILSELVPVFISGVAVLAFIAFSAMFLVWLERKVSALIQNRCGPMRTGWQGMLQTFADGIKLLLKENIIPADADIWIWRLAPFFVVIPAVMSFVPIPFSDTLIPHDLNMGILYILSISSLGVLGIFMAGWGSGNKYSLLGGMRSAAQIISYEIPLLLSVALIVMQTGTLSMQEIVRAQQSTWFIFYPNLALAFVVYLIAATAEVNRVPFDIPEAESELVAGFHTEYCGIKFSMFFVAEYTNLFIISAIAATLFLGGWNGPVLPPLIWFLIKTYAVVIFLMWVRWTLPRVRMDQMMAFVWKFLTPLAFVNLIFSAWLMLP